jgi:DtxR family transcriptional regulator, Mn-dependent transcriptional regulator
MHTRELSANMEDYLETIFHVIEQKQAAKSRDISAKMKVKSSSVTGALRVLSEHGLINYSPYDLITVTDKGRSMAQDIIRRHEALSNLFVRLLNCDKKTAEEAACGMEHALPPKMIEKLVNLVSFVEACPRCGDDWLRNLQDSCKDNELDGKCEKCILDCVRRLKKRTARGTKK